MQPNAAAVILVLQNAAVVTPVQQQNAVAAIPAIPALPNAAAARDVTLATPVQRKRNVIPAKEITSPP